MSILLWNRARLIPPIVALAWVCGPVYQISADDPDTAAPAARDSVRPDPLSVPPAGDDPFGAHPASPRASRPGPCGRLSTMADPFGTPSGGLARSSGRPSEADAVTSSGLCSATAQRVAIELDQPINVTLPATPIAELATLGEQLELPVLIDPHGIEAAGSQGSTAAIKANGLPRRTVLRRLLQPLALRAVVTDDGLLITADTEELARRGIGTSRWLNVDQDAADALEAKLDQTATLSGFFEESLDQVVGRISESLGTTVVIDRRALEEIGLTADVPVTIDIAEVSHRTYLAELLAPLDLTYQNRGELLAITTHEAAEARLLSRLYWLDATGFNGDPAALMKAIQATIHPSSWDMMGGPSVMVVLESKNRPALLVSTTSQVHAAIGRLLKQLREQTFGPTTATRHPPRPPARRVFPPSAQGRTPASDPASAADSGGIF